MGKAENMEPKAAKQIEARIIVKIKESTLPTAPPNIRVPTKIIKIEIARLKKNPARISPKIKVATDPGVVNNLSKVFVLISQGVIKGPTEEPAKKNEIAKRPGISSFTGIPLPKAKARNRKNGNNIPKIKIGDSV